MTVKPAVCVCVGWGGVWGLVCVLYVLVYSLKSILPLFSPSVADTYPLCPNHNVYIYKEYSTHNRHVIIIVNIICKYIFLGVFIKFMNFNFFVQVFVINSVIPLMPCGSWGLESANHYVQVDAELDRVLPCDHVQFTGAGRSLQSTRRHGCGEAGWMACKIQETR